MGIPLNIPEGLVESGIKACESALFLPLIFWAVIVVVVGVPHGCCYAKTMLSISVPHGCPYFCFLLRPKNKKASTTCGNDNKKKQMMYLTLIMIFFFYMYYWK